MEAVWRPSRTWSDEGGMTTGGWNDPQDRDQPAAPLLVPLRDECPPTTQSCEFQDPCSVVIPGVRPRGMCFRRSSTPPRPSRKEEALWILASARPKLHKQRLFCLPGRRRRRNSGVSLRSDHMTTPILPRHFYIRFDWDRSKCSLGCGSNSELRSVTADLCVCVGGCSAPLPVLALPLEGRDRVAEWKL